MAETQFVNHKDKSLTNILLIYMGGTIGMVEDPATGSLRAFDFIYFQEHVPELQRLDFNVSSIHFDPPIDSSNITVDLWMQLAVAISKNYDTFDGFVVLHGTDTMAYTACAMSFMLEGLQKPVIFTGSQLPIDRLRTDGKENLITALQIAAKKNTKGEPMVPEVCIYFNSKLMRGNRTIKGDADKFEAFASYNYPPLADAGIDITYYNKNIHRSDPFEEKVFNVNMHLEQNVTVLRIFPGITREIVSAILSLPALKGVVLETYGSGNAPSFPWFLEELKRAVERGVVIVNVTQCHRGSVIMNRYDTGAKLRAAGVISGGDMTTECALTKLMYLLGKPFSTQEVREQMQISICGEMTEE